MEGLEFDISQMKADCERALALERNSSSQNGSQSNGSCDFTGFYKTEEYSIMKDPIFISIIVISYSIVIILGGLGNILVVVTIAKTKSLWNATNIFIANLAMADILVCVFDLPLNAYYQLTDDWVFGKTLCHVIPSAFALVVYVSTLSLTLIAVDRFILIVHPLKKRMTVPVSLVLVVVICLVSAAVASPIAIHADYIEFSKPSVNVHWRFCGEKWPHPNHRRLYTILTLALQYFVPLIVIGILYTRIFKKVRESMKTRSGTNSRKTKTTKMLVAVVTIFAISWTPFQIFSLITEFGQDLVQGPYFKFMDCMLKVLAMSSSCINPILYGWLNDNYRNAFLSIIGKTPRQAPKGGASRTDVEHIKQPKKNVNTGNLRVSPGKCNSNGHSTKLTESAAISEERIPLRTLNNNGDSHGSARDVRESAGVVPSPDLSDRKPPATTDGSSSQSLLVKD